MLANLHSQLVTIGCRRWHRTWRAPTGWTSWTWVAAALRPASWKIQSSALFGRTDAVSALSWVVWRRGSGLTSTPSAKWWRSYYVTFSSKGELKATLFIALWWFRSLLKTNFILKASLYNLSPWTLGRWNKMWNLLSFSISVFIRSQ